jgi:hypothetical protein
MPGMVAPTFSTDDLGKRITDLKAVEGWLRMNLSMLQMTIQGLEMQQTTLSTVETVGKMVRNSGSSASAAFAESEESGGDGPTVGETLQRAALWPWDVMQHMQEKIQQHLQEHEAEIKANEAKKAAPRKAPAPPAKPAPRKAKRKTT